MNSKLLSNKTLNINTRIIHIITCILFQYIVRRKGYLKHILKYILNFSYIDLTCNENM